MALILVSGLPCSGRSTRSKQLIDDFSERITKSSDQQISSLRIVHLTNAEANVDRKAFHTQLKEKPARSAYLSLVMRSIAKDAIVFADGGAGTNIKGFRYQLWCAAREVGVRCASVLCAAKPDVCKRRNTDRMNAILESTESRQMEDAYENDTLDELLMRFEEPNAMTRWDSPLFVIDCTPEKDEDDSTCELPPFDQIWDAITKGEVKKAPDVVAPVRGTTSNYLSLLESTTQAVLSALQTLQSSGVLPEMGGQVQLSVQMQHSTPAVQKIGLFLPAGKRAPTTATLQRLRRQFVKMHASSAASQNEIGFAMGLEGRYTATSDHQKGSENSTGNSRAERKRTSEEEVAHRFVAYLEETL
ncbi:chromatin associated protein KTI12 [Meira miltonrushii]|uniref:Chromatin associated protein KTI12 n=1 Tax=Meira miltonrushii TaxID=1280837 RepID=A0A316VG75_9BASI|nr:chromatin associated protein KTI12 [Meira miltonrushii]PWN36629.1 chromatin associated protein KTI12 [Meira miltonrushii]